MYPTFKKIAFVGTSHTGAAELMHVVAGMWRTGIEYSCKLKKVRTVLINVDKPVVDFCHASFEASDVGAQLSTRKHLKEQNPAHQLRYLTLAYTDAMQVAMQPGNQDFYYIICVYNVFSPDCVPYLRENGFLIYEINATPETIMANIQQEYPRLDHRDAHNLVTMYGRDQTSTNVESITMPSSSLDPFVLSGLAGSIITKLSPSQ